jgi:hypothetical protein
MRCIWTRRWGNHHRQKLRMPPNSIPIPVAGGDLRSTANTRESEGHNNKLGPRNGRAAAPLACHGKVCPDLMEKHVALFSNNTPTVSWVTRLASKKSPVAELLIRALALHLKMTHTCPLTPLHIAGSQNAMTDIPSRSFGGNPL